MRFSWKSSGMMLPMFTTFTLLMMPFSDLRSASHVWRWYAGELLSSVLVCMRASLKGGMYTPPARLLFTSGVMSVGASTFCSSCFALFSLFLGEWERDRFRDSSFLVSLEMSIQNYRTHFCSSFERESRFSFLSDRLCVTITNASGCTI